MVRGPQGAFRPLVGAVKATTGARSLRTFPGRGGRRRDLVGRLSDGATSGVARAPEVQDHLAGRLGAVRERVQRKARSGLDVVVQLLGFVQLLELYQRVVFDLANALARDA